MRWIDYYRDRFLKDKYEKRQFEKAIKKLSVRRNRHIMRVVVFHTVILVSWYLIFPYTISCLSLQNDLKVRDEMFSLYTQEMDGSYTRCHIPRAIIQFPAANEFETGMDNLRASYANLPNGWLLKVKLNFAHATTITSVISLTFKSLIRECLVNNDLPPQPANSSIIICPQQVANHTSTLRNPIHGKSPDYVRELGPDRPCFVALFPLTMAGLLIEIWDPEEGGEGRLFHIPYGKIVMFPASVVFSHIFMTSLDGNLLAITHVFVNLGRPINETDRIGGPEVDQLVPDGPKYVHAPALTAVGDAHSNMLV
jgi:hypothetical protein